MPFLRTHWLATALFFLLLTPQLVWAQWRMVNDDCAFPTGKRSFNTVADDQPVTDADLDKPTKTAAKASAPNTHPAEVAASEKAYREGHYAEAAALLKSFASQKQVAPQVLHQYARSLYRIPEAKAQSYVVYQRLIALLDTYGREDAATSAIYLNFGEAYYKLATMQMDNAEWRLAAYNISRFLYTLNAVPSWKTDDIYEDALQYQTECFAELGNATLCRHYGQRTLKFFPKNQYVRPYLARLPPASKLKAK